MRLSPLLILALPLAACTTVNTGFRKATDLVVYKLPTRQGNVIEQRQLDQLQVGMTRSQVEFLLGTPIAASPFRADRWDYFGYYKSPRGEVSKRDVVLFFDANKLSHMEGVQVASAEQAEAKAVDDPDVEALTKQKKSDNSDRARDENPAGQPAETQLPSPEGSNLPSKPH